MSSKTPIPPGSSETPIPAPSQDTAPLRVGDLIEAPAVQTVVHMADLAHAGHRSQLAASFVLTDEVKSHLKRLLWAFTAERGLGSFLRGHYGSGKSHFLVFLQLLVTGHINIPAMIAADPDLAPQLERLQGRRFLAAPVSLVEHSAQEPLEAIVSEALESLSGPSPLPFPSDEELQAHLDTLRYHLTHHHPDVLEAFLDECGLEEATLFQPTHLAHLDRLAREVRFPFRPDPGRGARFEQLFKTVAESGCSGVVLLIDELSEFLHSKTGPALAEDVRFLQYLGEATSEYPLFIVAALQEYLEAAEYGLPGELVRKIKDRYPNNLELTTTHVEEIVSKRLIRHKPGANVHIEQIYRQLRTYLQGFPVPAERFIRAYPIHPATLLLLDRLKPLLSRSRGIVDFIHYRLKGSVERGLTGLLDAPADTLLTPDAIFDHFQWRFRENLEIAAYDTVVHDYYRKALETLFEDEATRALAARLIKLLILLAISPEPRPYSVKTLTHAVLVRVSRLDPDANFQHVQDILERLATDGAYVERRTSAPDAPRSFNDVYAISLKADLNLILSRRLQAAMASLRDAPDLRIFEALAPSLGLESLPLARFLTRGSQTFSIQWQRTPREGPVTVGSLTHLDVPRLVTVLEALETTEQDWALFIGTPYDVPAQQVHLEEVLLPALRRTGHPAARGILFWVPQPLGFEGDHGELLLETLARRAVLARAREEGATSQARALIALLEKGLEADKARLESLFHQTYYQGHIESIAGQEETLSNLGRPLFEQTLLAVLSPVLAARYPDHAQAAPLGRLPTVDEMETIVDRFFRPGLYTPKVRELDPLATRLISLLRPLGLVKKSGNTLHLSVDTARPGPARTLMGLLENKPRPITPVAQTLRKGTLGMAPPMFQLLTLGLAYAGVIHCYSRDRRREVDQFSALNFDQLDGLSRSDALQLDLGTLAEMPFLPGKLIPRGELTFARQEQLWQGLRTCRERLGSLLAEVRRGLERLEASSHLKGTHREPLNRALDALQPLALHERGGIQARAGIEETLQALSEVPKPREQAEILEAGAQFFRQKYEQTIAISRYIAQLGRLPEGLEHAALRGRWEETQRFLESEGLLTSPATWTGLELSFKQAQQDYIAAYRAGHEAWRGPERFSPYHALRTTLPYRLIRTLAGLRSLATDELLRPIDSSIEAATRQQCQRFNPDELFSTPLCRCGYFLGDTPVLPPLSNIQAQIQRALGVYLEALRSPETRHALEKAAAEREELKRFQQAARLRTLLAGLTAEHTPEMSSSTEGVGAGASGGVTDTTSDTTLGAASDTTSGAASGGATLITAQLEALETLLTGPVLVELESALQGTTQIVERVLSALTSQLVGRCLPALQVTRIVQGWLGEEATRGDVYIRVRGDTKTGDGPTGRPLGTDLERLLETRFPALLPVSRAIGVENLFYGSLLAEWCGIHGVNLGAREGLVRAGLGEVSLSAESLEALPALALALRNGPPDRLVAAIEQADQVLNRRDQVGTLMAQLDDLGSIQGAVAAFARERCFPSILRALGGHLLLAALMPGGPRPREALAAMPRGAELPPPLRAPAEEIGRALGWAEDVAEVLELASTLGGVDPARWEADHQARLAAFPTNWHRVAGVSARWRLLTSEELRGHHARFHEAFTRITSTFSADFNGFCAPSSRTQGAARPMWQKAALEDLEGYAGKMGDRDPLLWMVDVLDWELWRLLRESVQALNPDLRALREGLCWVDPANPLAPDTFLEAPVGRKGSGPSTDADGDGEASGFAGQGTLFAFSESGDASERNSAERGAGERGAGERRNTSGSTAGSGSALLGGPHRVMRFPVVADIVARSRGSLSTVHREILETLWAVLRPGLESLPEGRMVILTGGVGFMETAGMEDGARDHAYGSAVISPWTVLVPAVVIGRRR